MNPHRIIPLLTLFFLLAAWPPAAGGPALSPTGAAAGGRGEEVRANPGPAAPAPTGPVLHDTHTVTSTADSGPGSLRQALFDAGPGDTIGFSLTYPVTITLSGGELAITESLTILGPGPENLAVSGNHASRIFAIGGVSTTVALSGLTVADGYASEGGGIYNAGTLAVTHATFSGNWAGCCGFGCSGGGILNWGTLMVTDATFSGNGASGSGGAGNGGGIANGGTLTVTNATFSGNVASGMAAGGGGILNWGTLTVTNATFSGNRAWGGSGILNNGTLYLRSTIIANSIGGGDCYNGGTIGQNVANLVEDGSCDPLYSGDPNLGPLGDYGGDTWTHPLISPSLAIDHGDPATCPATDQRGYWRNGPCDIGAFEYNACAPVDGADFSWQPLTPTVDALVTFTGTVAGGSEPITYSWKLDVGSWKEGLVVTHSYSLPGPYTVWLTATNCATATSVASHTLVVTCPDVADTGFSWTPPVPEEGAPVVFTATASSPRPLSYAWDLGDGTVAAGVTVTHVYSPAGEYLLTLTATNDCGAWQAVTDTVVVVCPEVAAAGFTWTPAAPEVGDPVTFTAAASSTRPLTYTWRLDVGSWSAGQVVTHTYGVPGDYPVTMTATNDCGNWQAVTDTIVVVCPEVADAGFTWTPVAPVADDPVTFTATASSTRPLTYTWRLDVGSWSAGQVVTHTYGVPGDYPVTMTATNDCGAWQSTTDTVTVLPPECEAVSIVTVTAAVSGCVATLDAELTGSEPFAYLWDLGPFGTYSETNPVVDFQPTGTYSGTLSVWNCGNAEPATRAFIVEVACEQRHLVYLPLVMR